MSIISYGATPKKGALSTVTLNKAELSNVSVVSEDSYFSNSLNWKSVVVYMKSTLGNQKINYIFDATETSPTAKFTASTRSRDFFEIESIRIFDFDKGMFSLDRSSIPAPTISAVDINLRFFSRTFNTGTALNYEDIYADIAADHLLFNSGNDAYGIVDYQAEPKPVTFGEGPYRIEVDYYDLTTVAGTVLFSASGNQNGESVAVTNPSGTAVFDNVLLVQGVGEFGDEFWFQVFDTIQNAGFSVKITEIRFYKI